MLVSTILDCWTHNFQATVFSTFVAYWLWKFKMWLRTCWRNIVHCVKLCKIYPGRLRLCTSNSFNIFFGPPDIYYIHVSENRCHLSIYMYKDLLRVTRMIDHYDTFDVFLELVFAVLQTFFYWKFKWFELKTAESLNFEWMIDDWRSSLLN